jgi:ZIP family zinc transporter
MRQGDSTVDGLLIVLALAALPALGNLAGGLLAEVVEVSPRTLSLALHAAPGIALAVVGVKLLPARRRERGGPGK